MTPNPSELRRGLVDSGLAKLARLRHVDLKDAHVFRVGQTVTLPSANEPHVGTVSDVDARGFEVTYSKTARKRGEPREKFRYPWSDARHFTAVAHG